MSRTPLLDKLDKSILEARPRGGGFLKISSEEELQSPSCLCQTNDTDDIDWESVDNSSSDNESLPRSVEQNLLTNVISVVMLLASGNQPPTEQMQAVRDYLENVMTDDGSVPPNIQSLINHIDMVSESNENEEEQEQENDAENENENEEKESNITDATDATNE